MERLTPSVSTEWEKRNSPILGPPLELLDSGWGLVLQGDMTSEDAEKMLEKIAQDLGEHFEAVQILATWNQDGLSLCVKRGSGNWYARTGMAREFLVCDQAQTNADEIKRVLPKGDDGDGWKEGDSV